MIYRNLTLYLRNLTLGLHASPLYVLTEYLYTAPSFGYFSFTSSHFLLHAHRNCQFCGFIWGICTLSSGSFSMKMNMILFIKPNNILHLLINYWRTVGPTEMLCHFWVCQTICFKIIILFAKKKKKCWWFWDSAQDILNFNSVWGAVSPL